MWAVPHVALITVGELYLLRYNVVQFIQSRLTFRRNMRPIFTVEEYGKQALFANFMLVSCLAYSSILEMEAKRPSDTSLDYHRYVLEHSTHHNQRCENLKCSL
jgi:hypothetical protein